MAPTLGAAAAMVVLVSLGVWQLGRYERAHAIRAVIEERLAAPPLDAPTLTRMTPEAAHWRLATLTGSFLDVPPALITPRFAQGQPGYDVVQPLQVDGGPVVLVNRGWVPARGYAGHLATLTDPDVVRGIVLPVEGDANARPIPASKDAPERWRGPQWAAMAARWDLSPAVVVIQRGPASETGPRGIDPRPWAGSVTLPSPDRHLGYAGTWFGIALVLVASWGFGSLRSQDLNPESTPPGTRRDPRAPAR